jgi:hypothetical protein
MLPIETMAIAKIPKPTPKPTPSEDVPALLGAADAVGAELAVADTSEGAVSRPEAPSKEEEEENAVVSLADNVAMENAGSENAAVVYIAAWTVKARSEMPQHVVFVLPSLDSSGTTSPVLQHHLFSSLLQPHTSWSSPGLLLCTF